MKKSYRKLVFFLCLVTSFSVSAQKWDQNFIGASASGISGRDIVEFGGELYVGGVWNAAFQSFVMKWDGTDWSAVGTGFVENTDINAGIYALEVFNGELYAAGMFDISISSTNYKGIVKWNGTAWEPITDFPTVGFITVYDLIEFNGNIMIGGVFSGVFGGATTFHNIIGHNGTNWVPFDEGVNGGEVYTMDVHYSELYIAGEFNNDVANSTSLDNFAVWDGVNQEWDNVGAFATLYTNSGYIRNIKSYGSNLYVYTIRDDIFNTNPRLSKWDLASTITDINTVSVTPEFSRLASLTDMIIYDGNLVVAGSYRDSQFAGNSSPVQIETYDGTTWNKELPGGASASSLGVFGGKITTGIYVLNDPSATIESDKTVACENEPVSFSFTEVSSNPITSVNWTFEGGTPATSTELSPVVTYASGGNFDVTLEVTSSDGTNEVIAQNLILVDNDFTITNQPVDASICDTENATFSVFATGSGVAITYQWQMDDNSGAGFVDLDDGVALGVAGASIIGGSKTSVLTVAPNANGPSQNDLNGNKFRCVISKCTTVNSDEVVMNVTEAPVLAEAANHAAICESGDATISVGATSAGTLSYQWQYRLTGTNSYADLSDSGPYSGTSTASLNITGADNMLPELFDSDNTDGLTSAHFRCVISADGCEINSNISVLTIHGVPAITEEPADVVVCNSGQGVTTSFSVNSSLNNLLGLNYQWQVDDGNGFVDLSDDAVYSGVNSKTLDLTLAPSSLNGYQYRCEVGGCSSAVYSSAATLTIDDAPVITQQPITTSVCEGSDAVLTVVATGNNLSYQWQERIGSAFVDITNNSVYFASDNTLTIATSLSLHNRQYRCVITSGTCEINTSAPQLRVYEEPSFNQPAVTDVTACDDGNSSVIFNGPVPSDFNTAVHSYQWQEAFASTGIFVDISDDDKFSGTDTRILTITNPTVSMDGNQYRLKVDGCVNDVLSDPGTLSVKRQPIITESPGPQTVCFGEPISFSVTAVGDSDMTYDWQVSTDGGTTFGGLSGFVGQGTTMISSTGVSNTSMDGWIFKCVVSAASPCTTLTAESFEALLTINEVGITTQPVQQSVCENESAVFSVVAQGQSLTYQWLENGSPITDGGVYSGTTSNTLTITGTTSSLNGNQYSCTVSGLCDPATSVATSLVVTSVDKPELIADLTNSSSPTLSVSNISGDSYEWRLDGSVLNESGSSIVMTTEGSYTVFVTIGNCVSEESDAYEYSGAVLGFDDEDYIKIYPNPVQRFLEVGDDRILTIQVISLDGRAVLSGSVSKNLPLDISSLTSGQYMIRLYEQELLIYSSKILKIN